MFNRSTQLNREKLNKSKFSFYSFKNSPLTEKKISFKDRLIFTLVAIFVTLLTVYSTLIVAIVFNIKEKADGLVHINETSIKIAKVEKEYNLLVSGLTKDFALENGFIKASDNNFAFRKDSAAGFSFLYEEVNNSNNKDE